MSEQSHGRAGRRVVTRRWLVVLPIAITLIGLAAPPVLGHSSGWWKGLYCTLAYNNVDHEHDFLYAATSHHHDGPWYRNLGQHCHNVRAGIFRNALDGVPLDPAAQCAGQTKIVARTEYDGYVSVSAYRSPSNQNRLCSHHAGTTPDGKRENLFLKMHGAIS